MWRQMHWESTTEWDPPSRRRSKVPSLPQAFAYDDIGGSTSPRGDTTRNQVLAETAARNNVRHRTVEQREQRRRRFAAMDPAARRRSVAAKYGGGPRDRNNSSRKKPGAEQSLPVARQLHSSSEAPPTDAELDMPCAHISLPPQRVRARRRGAAASSSSSSGSVSVSVSGAGRGGGIKPLGQKRAGAGTSVTSQAASAGISLDVEIDAVQVFPEHVAMMASSTTSANASDGRALNDVAAAGADVLISIEHCHSCEHHQLSTTHQPGQYDAHAVHLAHVLGAVFPLSVNPGVRIACRGAQLRPCDNMVRAIAAARKEARSVARACLGESHGASVSMTAKLDLAVAAIAANSGVSVEEGDLMHARRSHRYGACEVQVAWRSEQRSNHGHQLARATHSGAQVSPPSNLPAIALIHSKLRTGAWPVPSTVLERIRAVLPTASLQVRAVLVERRRVLQFGAVERDHSGGNCAPALDGVLLSEREEAYDRPLRGGRCVLLPAGTMQHAGWLPSTSSTPSPKHDRIRVRLVQARTMPMAACVSSDTESEVDSHSESDDAVDVGTANDTENSQNRSHPRVVLASAPHTTDAPAEPGHIPGITGKRPRRIILGSQLRLDDSGTAQFEQLLPGPYEAAIFQCVPHGGPAQESPQTRFAGESAVFEARAVGSARSSSAALPASIRALRRSLVAWGSCPVAPSACVDAAALAAEDEDAQSWAGSRMRATLRELSGHCNSANGNDTCEMHGEAFEREAKEDRAIGSVVENSRTKSRRKAGRLRRQLRRQRGTDRGQRPSTAPRQRQHDCDHDHSGSSLSRSCAQLSSVTQQTCEYQNASLAAQNAAANDGHPWPRCALVSPSYTRIPHIGSEIGPNVSRVLRARPRMRVQVLAHSIKNIAVPIWWEQLNQAATRRRWELSTGWGDGLGLGEPADTRKRADDESEVLRTRLGSGGTLMRRAAAARTCLTIDTPLLVEVEALSAEDVEMLREGQQRHCHSEESGVAETEDIELLQQRVRRDSRMETRIEGRKTRFAIGARGRRRVLLPVSLLDHKQKRASNEDDATESEYESEVADVEDQWGLNENGESIDSMPVTVRLWSRVPASDDQDDGDRAVSKLLWDCEATLIGGTLNVLQLPPLDELVLASTGPCNPLRVAVGASAHGSTVRLFWGAVAPTEVGDRMLTAPDIPGQYTLPLGLSARRGPSATLKRKSVPVPSPALPVLAEARVAIDGTAEFPCGVLPGAVYTLGIADTASDSSAGTIKESDDKIEADVWESCQLLAALHVGKEVPSHVDLRKPGSSRRRVAVHVAPPHDAVGRAQVDVSICAVRLPARQLWPKYSVGQRVEADFERRGLYYSATVASVVLAHADATSCTRAENSIDLDTDVCAAVRVGDGGRAAAAAAEAHTRNSRAVSYMYTLDYDDGDREEGAHESSIRAEGSSTGSGQLDVELHSLNDSTRKLASATITASNSSTVHLEAYMEHAADCANMHQSMTDDAYVCEGDVLDVLRIDVVSYPVRRTSSTCFGESIVPCPRSRPVGPRHSDATKLKPRYWSRVVALDEGLDDAVIQLSVRDDEAVAEAEAEYEADRREAEEQSRRKVQEMRFKALLQLQGGAREHECTKTAIRTRCDLERKALRLAESTEKLRREEVERKFRIAREKERREAHCQRYNDAIARQAENEAFAQRRHAHASRAKRDADELHRREANEAEALSRRKAKQEAENKARHDVEEREALKADIKDLRLQVEHERKESHKAREALERALNDSKVDDETESKLDWDARVLESQAESDKADDWLVRLQAKVNRHSPAKEQQRDAGAAEVPASRKHNAPEPGHEHQRDTGLHDPAHATAAPQGKPDRSSPQSESERAHSSGQQPVPVPDPEVESEPMPALSPASAPACIPAPAPAPATASTPAAAAAPALAAAAEFETDGAPGPDTETLPGPETETETDASRHEPSSDIAPLVHAQKINEHNGGQEAIFYDSVHETAGTKSDDLPGDGGAEENENRHDGTSVHGVDPDAVSALASQLQPHMAHSPGTDPESKLTEPPASNEDVWQDKEGHGALPDNDHGNATSAGVLQPEIDPDSECAAAPEAKGEEVLALYQDAWQDEDELETAGQEKPEFPMRYGRE